MELKLRITIQDDDGKKFLGKGVLQLLEGIEGEGSLRQAAVKTGISYSKAHRMISFLEQSVGGDIVTHSKGGQDRHGSVLTPLGVAILKSFNKLESKCLSDSENYFKEFEKEITSLEEALLDVRKT